VSDPNQKQDHKLPFRALTFAAYKHRHQRRKGVDSVPYVTDTATIAAAILHDTVEDTETTLLELENEFGATIAKLVAELSDNKSLPSEKRKRLQIEHAPSLSPRARLVKLADKICNLRDMIGDPPKGWSLKRKQEYFDWGKSVVDQIRGTNAALEQAFDAAFSKRP
jgi:guanosine-3',5'-bis(diphosphate) 3'-pyrophosphohydrolase